MAGGGGGERTESATPKRRQDERKKGNVFKSQELITLASLLAALYAIQFFGNIILQQISGSFERFWGQAALMSSIETGDVSQILINGIIVFFISAMPPLLAAGLAAVIVTVAQTRGLMTFSLLAPKGERLSPLKGIKKILSMRGLVELIKSILKIVILGYVVYGAYVEQIGSFARLMEMEFLEVIFYAAAFVMDIIMSAAIIFAFLAAADYMYQRWQYEKDMRMSKQEIKEEYKQTEGDPQIKGQIRQKQRQMAMSRMMANVPEADVVVRNPTHYAVALKYEPKSNTAPMVIAKGADLMALRIIKEAEAHDVEVVENKPLARGLYDGVPLDAQIPEQFFKPIAEILAFVYSKSKKEKHKMVTQDAGKSAKSSAKKAGAASATGSKASPGTKKGGSNKATPPTDSGKAPPGNRA